MRVYIVYRPSARSTRALDSMRVFREEDKEAAFAYRQKLTLNNQALAYAILKTVETPDDPTDDR